MALFCAAIRRDSVSVLKFPFLSHFQVFLWEILLVCHLKCPYSLFYFPVLFSGYFCSVDACIVSIYYLYYYYYSFWVFFTPELADSFSLEFEWQQVSSSLRDSSLYSGQSQQSYSLDGFHSPSYFQVLQSLYQYICNCTECTSYNWYHCHFRVP